MGNRTQGNRTCFPPPPPLSGRIGYAVPIYDLDRPKHDIELPVVERDVLNLITTEDYPLSSTGKFTRHIPAGNLYLREYYS